MREFSIEKGIVIDDIDKVVRGIGKISGKQIPDAETIRKFIMNEKNTRFYLDNKCNCRMQPEGDTKYLWLDSGFTDPQGNPVMISLLKESGEYIGHYIGTMNNLADKIREHYPRNIRDINKNLETFKKKYLNKAASREYIHIDDEQAYLLGLCNGKDSNTLMADLLRDIVIISEPEEEVTAKAAGETAEEVMEEAGYGMSLEEKEITVGLLLDAIDGMQSYIDELLAEIEKFNSEDRVRMQELEAKNEEYKKALVQMRSFMETEAGETEEKEITGFGGHELLGRNGKILVLGATALDMNTMNGIAKLYGFQKKDFEYETDYSKIKNFTGRMSNGERYSAVILGACPHKVAGLGDWSSLIEKCRRSEEMPWAIDARSRSGELKVTKESFKLALMGICEELKKAG